MAKKRKSRQNLRRRVYRRNPIAYQNPSKVWGGLKSLGSAVGRKSAELAKIGARKSAELAKKGATKTKNWYDTKGREQIKAAGRAAARQSKRLAVAAGRQGAALAIRGGTAIQRRLGDASVVDAPVAAYRSRRLNKLMARRNPRIRSRFSRRNPRIGGEAIFDALGRRNPRVGGEAIFDMLGKSYRRRRNPAKKTTRWGTKGDTARWEPGQAWWEAESSEKSSRRRGFLRNPEPKTTRWNKSADTARWKPGQDWWEATSEESLERASYRRNPGWSFAGGRPVSHDEEFDRLYPIRKPRSGPQNNKWRNRRRSLLRRNPSLQNPTTMCGGCGKGNNSERGTCWKCGSDLRPARPSEMFFGTWQRPAVAAHRLRSNRRKW